MKRIKNLNAVPLGKKLTIAIDIDGTVADSSRIDFRKVNKDPAELLKARPKKALLKQSNAYTIRVI